AFRSEGSTALTCTPASITYRANAWSRWPPAASMRPRESVVVASARRSPSPRPWRARPVWSVRGAGPPRLRRRRRARQRAPTYFPTTSSRSASQATSADGIDVVLPVGAVERYDLEAPEQGRPLLLGETGHAAIGVHPSVEAT